MKNKNENKKMKKKENHQKPAEEPRKNMEEKCQDQLTLAPNWAGPSHQVHVHSTDYTSHKAINRKFLHYCMPRNGSIFKRFTNARLNS